MELRRVSRDMRRVSLGTEESYPAGIEEDFIELRRTSSIRRRFSWEVGTEKGFC